MWKFEGDGDPENNWGPWNSPPEPGKEMINLRLK